eukprot:6178306-Pleurochrysis_carterae.AAC.8
MKGPGGVTLRSTVTRASCSACSQIKVRAQNTLPTHATHNQKLKLRPKSVSCESKITSNKTGEFAWSSKRACRPPQLPGARPIAPFQVITNAASSSSHMRNTKLEAGWKAQNMIKPIGRCCQELTFASIFGRATD